jgi:dephospho-CoA kinase
MVVAVTDPKVQMQRLCARDPHLSEEDASNRVLSQGDVREKADRAAARGPGRGVVIWNDGDQTELKNKIDLVMAEIKSRSPNWWTWLCLVCPPLGISTATWAVLQNWLADRSWLKKKAGERARL